MRVFPPPRATEPLFMLLSVLAAGVPPAAQAKMMPRSVPARERVEFVKLLGELGYTAVQDGRVLFSSPYRRQTLDKVVSKACSPDLVPEGRTVYFRLLTSVIQFWEVPVSDLKEQVRPAVARAAEGLAKQPQQDAHLAMLVTEARRCLWNLDYALASAEIERLEKQGTDASKRAAKANIEELDRQGIERAKPARADYSGDLVSWYLRGDLELATQKIRQLSKVKRNYWRVMAAQIELRIRRELQECENDDQRVAILARAVKDRDIPVPVQGWALRSLSNHPTEEAVKFLLDIFQNAAKTKRYDLGLEAQEALKRLKKIPDGVSRYSPPP